MAALAKALEDASGLDYATFVSDNRTSRYVFLAGFVILVYDHLLTLKDEVKYVWSTKLRPSTCWFLAMRYTGLVGNITVAMWHFADVSQEFDYSLAFKEVSSFTPVPLMLNHSTDSCVNLQWAWTFLIVLLETFIEVTLAIRVYAMYGLNRWILGILLSAAGFILASGMLAMVDFGKDPNRHDLMTAFNGCATILPRSSAVLPAAVWEATVMCDILVFVLTVRKAFIQRRSDMMFSGSLIQRMATDGSMYFGIIILSNLANVMSFYLGDALIAGFLSWFTTSLSLTLLSRLMLNLHDVGSVRFRTIDHDHTTTTDHDHEMVHFALPIRVAPVDDGALK
ncbi:hypothetical protein MSAN_01336000 [Mycena sanguinolenta]|uniref:DUF6533 domain-containing protein n=1 Tax=Mycena sanguinolenta TaxID=230812 RepID=A0A8H7D0V9_9AGAR|nr:hypothetical protein MSAN_01336000 [Mycena sanguinolenta]